MTRQLHRCQIRRLLIGMAVVISGCQPGTPKTVPVSGTVFHQGKPVEGVTVVFTRGGASIGNGEVAVGKTDANGKFELTSHFGPQASASGAVAGEYKVTISKAVPPPNIDPEKYKAMVAAANQISEAGGMLPPGKQPPPQVELFPPKYSGMATSTLTASVKTDGPNVFEFKSE